jgi:hypothetical protein
VLVPVLQQLEQQMGLDSHKLQEQELLLFCICSQLHFETSKADSFQLCYRDLLLLLPNQRLPLARVLALEALPKPSQSLKA